EALGKPAGSDLREGKVTLPAIYALQDASIEERRLLESVLADGGYERTPFARILAIVERHHAIERAYERAHSFTERSRAILGEFPESPAQRSLAAIVDLITARSS
ncbi:MAG: polyprenyl synthetase family protein, partial [Bryobacteraceae bacterium]